MADSPEREQAAIRGWYEAASGDVSERGFQLWMARRRQWMTQ